MEELTEQYVLGQLTYADLKKEDLSPPVSKWLAQCENGEITRLDFWSKMESRYCSQVEIRNLQCAEALAKKAMGHFSKKLDDVLVFEVKVNRSVKYLALGPEKDDFFVWESALWVKFDSMVSYLKQYNQVQMGSSMKWLSYSSFEYYDPRPSTFWDTVRDFLGVVLIFVVAVFTILGLVHTF